MKKILSLLALLLVAGSAAIAGDLTYSTPKPQTTDNELVIQHKSHVAISKLANGNSVSHIAVTGTTSFPAAVFDQFIVNTAGSADSSTAIKSGTTTLATISTAAQASLKYAIAVASGTLTVITSGTTSPDLTVSYR